MPKSRPESPMHTENPSPHCNSCQVGNDNRERPSHMPSGLTAVSTVASMDFPCLNAQPGLVSPDHQGQVMIVLQNCGDEDIIIPRFSNIGYIENVKIFFCHFPLLDCAMTSCLPSPVLDPELLELPGVPVLPGDEM